MNRHNNLTRRCLRPSLLACAIGLALSAQQAQALNISSGDLNINIDTTLSYGVGMRFAKRDDRLIAKSHFDPTIGGQPLATRLPRRAGSRPTPTTAT